jgi:hypothetical protein
MAVTVGHGQDGMFAIAPMLGKYSVANPHDDKKTECDPIGPWQQLNDFHALNTNQRKRTALSNCPFISHATYGRVSNLRAN